MAPDSEHLRSLLEAVSDGTPVDWDATRRDASDEAEHRLVEALRLVARVGEAHRVLPEPLRGPWADATETSAGARPVPKRWGPLHVVAHLGQGGFGDVFRAVDPKLDREVALKLLREKESGEPNVADAVIREGRLLARVKHANVATVFGAERHDGRVGIWMEFIRGKDLAQLLNEQGPLGAREATGIGLDLCRALAAVHAAGVVHRDVKAQNVMREEGGRIVLMDFGAGLESGEGDAALRSVSGTPLYMAPEIFRGETVTPRSDIYSLGVLLYYLATGAFPVSGRTIDEIAAAHEAGDARLLRDTRPDLPDAFVQAVERAIARDPARRFASAGAFEMALAATVGGRAPDGGEPEHQDRGFRFGLRLGRWQLTVAASALVLVIAVALSLRREIVPSPVPSSVEPGVAASGPAMPSPLPAAPPPLAGARPKSVLDNEERAALAHRAALLAALGRKSDAREQYEKLLGAQEASLGENAPEIAPTLAQLAWLHRSQGDAEGASRLLDRAKSLGPAPPRPAGGGTVSLADVGAAAAPEIEYRVEAALFRSHGPGTPPERLEEGARVVPGDALYIEMEASASLHVYVLDQDEIGNVFALFPMPGYDATNPLAAGARHRLPGSALFDGKARSWQVNSAGGREHILIVASPVRLAELEAFLRKVPRPREGQDALMAAEMPGDTVVRLRGIGSVVRDEDAPRAAAVPPAGLGDLLVKAEHLAAGDDSARGVWIRKLTLDNPTR